MTLSGIAAAWWQWMGTMLWQSTMLFVAIAVLDRAFRRRLWPELIHGAWLLCALKLLLPPGLPSPFRAPAPEREAILAPSRSASLLVSAFALWAIGFVVALAFQHLRHRRFAARVLAGSRPASEPTRRAAERAAARLGLRHPVPVLELGGSSGATGAFVLGLRRPVVVVPSAWADRGDQLEHVLLHELTHVKRRDLWVEQLFALLQAAYWFHPLVAYARHRARAARELCCDATVVRALEGSAGYRRTLLRLGADLAAPRRSPAAARLFESRSLLLVRLDALERRSRFAPGLRRLLAAAACTLAALLALPLAAPRERRGTTTDTAAAADSELQRARADLEALARRDDVGSLHLRWAVARVQALEERGAAEASR